MVQNQFGNNKVDSSGNEFSNIKAGDKVTVTSGVSTTASEAQPAHGPLAQLPTSGGQQEISNTGSTASSIAMISKGYNMKNALYSSMAYGKPNISAYSPALKQVGRVFGNVALAANTVEYGAFINEGGSVGLNPQTVMYGGDVILNRVGVSSPQGFLMNASWEGGKMLGRLKNHYEIKNSPGGLDGLISTDN